jgi:hypothetical protein
MEQTSPTPPIRVPLSRAARAAVCIVGATAVLGVAGCGGSGGSSSATTAGAQSTTPAQTSAPSATTPTTSSTASGQSRSKTQSGTTPSTTPSTPQTTRNPKPIRSASALAAGKAACQGKKPKDIVTQYLPEAKASNPTWAKSAQAKQLLTFIDKVPPQAQSNPQLQMQFAPVAAIVYALSVKGPRNRQDAFNGCVTALGGIASTAAPPTKTTK